MNKRETRKLENENKVFEFIKKYIGENGYAPCVREICKSCDIKSTASVFTIINRLKERGLLEKSNVIRRAITLKSKTVSVPVVGTVAAGQPILAQENLEGYLSLPEDLFSKDDELFMLNVQGFSMKKIGMYEGDKIIVRRQSTANNGDIVVAMVDDSATVKRFFVRDGKYHLHPENDDMRDFVLDEVNILGKVVGLIRTF